MTLENDYLAVQSVQTSGQLHAELTRFTRKLGFTTFTASVVLDHPSGEPEFLAVDNAPRNFLPLHDDPERGKLNPVNQHCKFSSLPIIWDQDTYLQAGRMALWEEQARFGYCFGICSAMHLPNSRHFLFGLDRDQALPEDARELSRLVAEVKLFSVFAQEATDRLLAPSVEPTDVTLTGREAECLRWTLAGKTAWEIGQILGIAETTVARHAHNASRKLGCVSKHQAALKAVRLKLL